MPLTVFLVIADPAAIIEIWKSLMSNPTSSGIDPEVLHAARNTESANPDQGRETEEQARAGGWEPRQGKSAKDVYSSRKAKEIHDFVLKHRLPLGISNDLLKLVNQVSHRCIVHVICQIICIDNNHL